MEASVEDDQGSEENSYHMPVVAQLDYRRLQRSLSATRVCMTQVRVLDDLCQEWVGFSIVNGKLKGERPFHF
jgi:hypothetical protein